MKIAFIILQLTIFYGMGFLQRVAINADGSPATDPKAILELNKSLYWKSFNGQRVFSFGFFLSRYEEY